MRLRLGTSDIDTFIEVMVEAEYDFELRCEPQFIIDAGANIGLTSVWLANRFPNATVVALEPDIANYELLESNAAHFPNIHPLQMALWSEVTELDLVDPGLGPWAYQVTEAALPGQGGARARATTVPALMEEYGFDRVGLLKLDIEGAEKEVFEASGPWIDRVDAVAVELHDRFKPGCTDAFEAAMTRHRWRQQRLGTILASR